MAVHSPSKKPVEETEDDFADLDFDNLDDMDFEETAPAADEKQAPEASKSSLSGLKQDTTEEKPHLLKYETSAAPNRGFIHTALQKSTSVSCVTSDWDNTTFSALDDSVAPQVSSIGNCTSLPLIDVDGTKVRKL